MAPSTATPSNLHRAPVACLRCRAAKVRCLVSQAQQRCHRCVANDTDCVFAQPKRTRARMPPYARETQGPASRRHRHRPAQSPQSQSETGRRDDILDDSIIPQLESPVPQEIGDTTADLQIITPTSHEPAIPGRTRSQSQGQGGHHHFHPQREEQQRQPLITPDIRARIVTALATFKGKRGAPFSFITSGEQPHQCRNRRPSVQPSQTSIEPSMSLASILRPVTANYRAEVDNGGTSRPSMASTVKMPTYLASMTLGQIVQDPIDSGIVDVQASKSLFGHFMHEMNAKWEYLLDPRADTHDSVRARNRFLFSTILFCSSKFVSYSGSNSTAAPDPYLQTRLCSLARSWAISMFAQGERSIETMQAFYLLVCWKDPEDDVSYLHSGYSSRIMQDLDLTHDNADSQKDARRRRMRLALFRQDKQQSLFFVRRKPNVAASDESDELEIEGTCLTDSHALPLDLAGCCSADIRRIQSRLRALVSKSSSSLQPCLLEAMDSDLGRWRATWKGRFSNQTQDNDGQDGSPTSEHRLLRLERSHWSALMGLWEHSVKLSIASMVLRKVLTSSAAAARAIGDEATSSDRLELPGIGEVSSPNVPGLRESIEGAFGTLQALLAFPVEDLRRAPDSTLLLGPNAALFLCLLLVFPCDGILGDSFQRATIALIKDLARHIRRCVESPQDTVNLHSAYLDSLVGLVSPTTTGYEYPEIHRGLQTPSYLPSSQQMHPHTSGFDDAEFQAAQDLAGMAGLGGTVGVDENFGLSSDFGLDQGNPDLVDLLDTCFFWDGPSGA